MSRRTFRGFAAHLLPAIIYAFLIYFVSSLSAPPAPVYPFEWGDKINHAGAFGLMMILNFRALRWLFPDRPLAAQLIAALISCSLYGATDEYHQSFVPNRTSDPMDWVADTVGAALALLFILATLRTRLGRLLFNESRSRRCPPSGRV